MFEALRTVGDQPLEAIADGHAHTCLGTDVSAEGDDDITIAGYPERSDMNDAPLI